MGETGKEDWATHSLLAQLRPEPGWKIDRACIASYSADVRVVTAALLALSGAAMEPEKGTAPQLVKALRDLQGRVSFLVQCGRILWPRGLPRVAALLDRFLFTADCDESSLSWHPKFAVMRWKDANGRVAWRAWLGSRNLTRDLSRDAGLILTQAEASQGQALPELRLAVEALQRRLPKTAGRFRPAELEELQRVTWAHPAGVTSMRLHWLDGRRDRFPVMTAPCHEAIVVSPFVKAKAMRRMVKWMTAGRKPALVSSGAQFNIECRKNLDLIRDIDLCVCATAPEEGTPYEQPPARTGEDREEAEREVHRADEGKAFHAKLIYLRKGQEKRLWLGSPNATDRGWERNLEIVAELTSSSSSDPWGPALRAIVDRSSRFDADDLSKEGTDETTELLEELRVRISAGLVCHQKLVGNAVRLVANVPPPMQGARVRFCVGTLWPDCELATWRPGEREISLGQVPTEARTDFVLCVLRKGEDKVGWLMRAPFRPALPQGRDSAVLREYLGPRGYLDLISSELEAGQVAAPPWDALPGRKSERHGKRRERFGMPTLEGLLRLYLKEPEKLHAVGKTVALMEKEVRRWEADGRLSKEEKSDLLLFRRLWREVGSFLQVRAPVDEA
jgi:hypothetical protein